MNSGNEFWIGSRKSRFESYSRHNSQTFPSYSSAYLARQKARVGIYDAQIFQSSDDMSESTLVYANPRRRDLRPPHARVRDAFDKWGDCGLMRVLFGRKSVERRYPEVLFFCYDESVGRVSYIVNRVIFEPNYDAVFRYSITYRIVQGVPILLFGNEPVVKYPSRSGKIEGIHVSDICLEREVYFGYTDANAIESDIRFDQLFDLSNPYEA